MAYTEYSYSISQDTANGSFDARTLLNEVIAAGITEAVKVRSAGDTLYVGTDPALDSTDEATVTSTVGAHTGPPASVVNSTVIVDGNKYRAKTAVDVAGIVTIEWEAVS